MAPITARGPGRRGQRRIIPPVERFDVVIVGAGAAGLFAAGVAGQRGLRVLLLDHASRLAEKIRISGGGRCNFTNRAVGPANFLSARPNFCRAALAAYTSRDFIALVERHHIAYHEKHRGQLFCDRRSDDIISMLLAECASGSVTRRQPCAVRGVQRSGSGFELSCDGGPVWTPQLVVASGGLSIPKIGASDFGYRLARQFGHSVIEPRPALVPLTFDAPTWAPFAALAGLSLEVAISAGRGRAEGRFVENLLFTHRGLSGPAVLQASSYWQPGTPLRIDLAPDTDLRAALLGAKTHSRRQLGNQLADWLPQRLAASFPATLDLDATRPLSECRDRDLDRLAQTLARWEPRPDGTEGWPKAEVTAGGIDTGELDSATLQSRLVPGLYFIGEVVDVTGWLGGYNFQWAWSSAAACGRALARDPISG